MLNNGVGRRGRGSETTSTPKEWKSKGEARAAHTSNRNVERARGALWA